MLAALQRALFNLGIKPHDVAIVAGIGCSGKIGNYINCYNMHVVHGRALPDGARASSWPTARSPSSRPGATATATRIGMGHFLHAVRRNPDITYIVMDNHVYGLTKGQISPTSDLGFSTKASPQKNIERPVKPLQLALAAGATFVAQGFSSDVKQLHPADRRGDQAQGLRADQRASALRHL